MSGGAPPIDTARVEAYLSERDIAMTGALRARLITGGRSALTYELTDDAGRRHVLRTPPRTSDTAESHDISREYSILAALAQSPVPVPRMEALCEDNGVLGAPFYVAEFVDGTVLGTRSDGAGLEPAARVSVSHSIVDALAAIHSVDVVEVGLDGLGRGTGYLERQLRRWSARAAGPDALSGPLILEVHDALAAHVPEPQRACLVHGDYKFPNVMIDVETGAVRAVLDWELATLGDPLADLGNLLAMWPNPGEPALFDAPTSNHGFLTRADVVERYASRSRLDVSAADWYQAFALWKVACLLTGVVERYRAGAMAEDDFDVDAGARLVGELAEAARALALEQRPAAAPRGR
jgi:aminoglycoside phosphotransferase (APT) family kinase protein